MRSANVQHPHLASGLAALSAAGRAAAAALDDGGDRKKGQSEEREGVCEDHCVRDGCEGEGECNCFAGDELVVRPEVRLAVLPVFYSC